MKQVVDNFRSDQGKVNTDAIQSSIKKFFTLRSSLGLDTAREFCEITRCESLPIISQCLSELINEIHWDLVPHPMHIQSLHYFIKNCERPYLDPHILVQCTTCLLKKIDPNNVHVSVITLPYVMSIVNIVDCCFYRLIEAGVKKLDKDGLYNQYGAILQKLCGNSHYHIEFHAKKLQEQLRTISDDESVWRFRFRVGLLIGNGLLKVGSSVGSMDLSKALEGVQSIIEALQEVLSAMEGVVDVKNGIIGLVDSLKSGKEPWMTVLDRVEYVFVYMLTLNSDAEIRRCESNIHATFVARACKELCFGMLLGFETVVDCGTLEARRVAVDTIADFFRKQNHWGITAQVVHKKIPPAVREEALRILLHVAKFNSSEEIRLTAIDVLKSVVLAQAAGSTGSTILKQFFPLGVIDLSNVTPRRVETLDGLPLPACSVLCVSDSASVDRIEQGIASIRSDLRAMAGRSLIDAFEAHRQRIKIDENRRLENQSYIASTCVPSEGLIHRLEEAVSLDTVFDDFMTNESKKVLLLKAPAGSGKTVFTHRIAQLYLDRYTAEGSGRIPLRIELRGLHDPVRNAMEEGLLAQGFTEQHIEQLKRMSVLIIIDAVDEGRTSTGQALGYLNPLFLTNRLYLWDDIKVVFGVRMLNELQRDSQFYPYVNESSAVASAFQKAILCPFSADKQRAYIDQYVSNAPADWTNEYGAIWTAEKYTEEIDSLPGFKGLVQNPFYLRIAVEVLPGLVDHIRSVVLPPPESAGSGDKDKDEDDDAISAQRKEVESSMLIEAFVEAWILRQEKKLVGRVDIDESLEGNLRNEVWSYCMRLAVAMRQRDTTIAVHKDMRGMRVDRTWDEFFADDRLRDDALQRKNKICREMAPIKCENNFSYAFLHSNIGTFLAALYARYETEQQV